MPSWTYFVGWFLTCAGFAITFGLVLRKEHRDAAAAKVAAEATVRAALIARLEKAEQSLVAGEAEREALTNVLDKMGHLHEQVIVVVTGHAHTRREIDDLKTSVLDIRQELRLIRLPHALAAH